MADGMQNMILPGKAESLWRIGSAITFMIVMKLPLSLKILEFFLSRQTRKSTHPVIGPLQPVLLTDGVWWHQRKNLPRTDRSTHTYFNRNGTALADSLRNSEGRDALLTSAHFPVAILRHSWPGLQITSRNTNADRELSSGTAGPPKRIVRIRDAVIALQRNDQNYFEFTTDVLPSLLAWESPELFSSHLVIARSSFAEPLLRLIGFKGPITQIAAPFIAVATNITAIRLLNSGVYYPTLFKEIARRGHCAVGSSTGREVVFISRSGQSDRQLTNEAEVATTIKEHFPDADILYPGEVPVEEQVRRMANARIVIATHGAGAVNMVWATAMEHYVEISFYSPEIKQCFSALAKVLTGASVQFVRSRALKPGDHRSDHACDLDRLRAVLRQLPRC